jgi:hypothetical protein
MRLTRRLRFAALLMLLTPLTAFAAQLAPGAYKKVGVPVYATRDDGWYYHVTTGQFALIKNNVAYAASGQILVSDGTDFVPVTPSGAVTMSAAGVFALVDATAANSALAKPRMRVVREQVTAAGLTDGGGASGTKVLTASIPAGAVYIQTAIDTIVGFTGDTSAVIIIGDGTDTDRYNTGTPSVFTTAAAGVDLGVPSGTKFHSAAKTVTVTVTSATDITPVLASGGSFFLTLCYLEPI